MAAITVPNFVAWSFPLKLSYISWPYFLAIFALAAAVVVLLAFRSLAGLGPVRRWVAMGMRLAVLLLLMLILGGARWQRTNKDVEVIILGDLSASIQNVANYPGDGPGKDHKTIEQSLEQFYRQLAKDNSKGKDDRVGLISFGSYARVDAMPNKELRLDTRGITPREMVQGTDAASAIQLALATMSPDAMHRFVLVGDGNFTTGDTDAAVAAAAAAGVPIDIVPLKYDVKNEVLVERFVAPTWKRENEPFNLTIVMKSTNATPVTGKLRVVHQTQDGDVDLDMDTANPGMDRERKITLEPGLHSETVKVPALKSSGVHRFHAVFTPDKPETTGVTANVAGQRADTLDENNVGDAFTFVRGKGQVLYVDNAPTINGQRTGDLLAKAMAGEGINLKAINVDQFPNNLIDLQNYDAIVLHNVARGAVLERDANGQTHAIGLSTEQDAMIKTYVHDMGGGLVMIGGPDSFGAGGWEGSEVEKILPVDMAIPAQRQVGKGALALIMHSCEMPNGNYWGEMCAIKATEALGSRDEIGVISYGWNNANQGIGGAAWDFPLSEKGDGSRVISAIKKMQLGDMPSFDDAVNLALNGVNGGPGLLKSNARHKHIIIVSDGDPAAPQQNLMNLCKKNKISISTITVYPHNPGQSGRPPTMDDIAAYTGGKPYGPIESNPNQLPQIFIKEATIVKRSLIHEPEGGIPIKIKDGADDMIKGLGTQLPVLRGMVLTSRKSDPKVEMPYAAGSMNDPILAHWQTGLGKSAAWTSDATIQWSAAWVGSEAFAKLWAQIIRGVSRPPMSGDFDVKTTIEGNVGTITVEALDKDGQFANFININGTVVGGADLKTPQSIRLVQKEAGVYVGKFDASGGEGSYIAALNYSGKGANGTLITGAVMNSAPERRDLKSNEPRMEQVRAATGGRLIEPFTSVPTDLFSRDGLKPGAAPTPVWDLLLPWLLALIILDVAVRRIAWDWMATKRLFRAIAERIQMYTTLRKVEAKPTLDALRKVREEVAATTQARGAGQGMQAPPPVPGRPPVTTGRPDPKAKFQARTGVEGDITQVVGGATDKPIPSAPKKIEPKGARPAPGTGEHLGGLMAAKKRAQQQIKEKEEGQGQS